MIGGFRPKAGAIAIRDGGSVHIAAFNDLILRAGAAHGAAGAESALKPVIRAGHNPAARSRKRVDHIIHAVCKGVIVIYIIGARRRRDESRIGVIAVGVGEARAAGRALNALKVERTANIAAWT